MCTLKALTDISILGEQISADVNVQTINMMEGDEITLSKAPVQVQLSTSNDISLLLKSSGTLFLTGNHLVC